jgi:hypothetical protein
MERKRKQKEVSIAKKVLCSPKKSHEGNYSPNSLPKLASLMYNMDKRKQIPNMYPPGWAVLRPCEGRLRVFAGV